VKILTQRKTYNWEFRMPEQETTNIPSWCLGIILLTN
jgi:hypothetical protein